MRPYFFSLSVVVFAVQVSADINDWVNPSYVLGSTNDAGTSGARQAIIRWADQTAHAGPWTVSDANSVRAPSKDPRDYLSWAPYHWPRCNWCFNGGRTHVTTGGNSTDEDDMDEYSYDEFDDPTFSQPPSCDETDHCSSIQPSSSSEQPSTSLVLRHWRFQRAFSFHGGRYMGARQVDPASPPVSSITAAAVISTITGGEVGSFLTASPTTPSLFNETSTLSPQHTIVGTPAPAQNPAKTQKAKKPAPSCTPSPTKSLPPSATWTMCPYVTRDGQLNPDVRKLHGINAVNGVTQSVIYNALAYAFTKTPTYSKQTTSFVQTFFLDPSAGMNPNLEYGQLIRGPNIKHGQYLGVLDFRGMIKVANAVQILKAARSPDWTKALDGKMQDWIQKYLTWLQSDSLGKRAGSSPNNHGSFYFNQMAALNIMLGNTKAASDGLVSYFQHQFLDQIAASGEQPFEAVRTRPFHYRCFNLEAMIANAKLGDQLGLNLWTAKSKYGSTIQTALDFLMKQDPGKEDVKEILPHVGAVSAAYGDPNGKYAVFLQRVSTSYKSAPFWYFDQPAALKHTPARGKRRFVGDDDVQKSLAGLDDVGTTTPTIPFECPAVFATEERAQLDDGVYVTCEQLKPLYGYVNDHLS